MLVITVLMLAAEKNKATFIAPVGIGLALFICELGGTYPETSHAKSMLIRLNQASITLAVPSIRPDPLVFTASPTTGLATIGSTGSVPYLGLL